MRLRVAVVTALALAAAPAAAHAESRPATLSDPAGDTSGQQPDLTGATLAYDTTGVADLRLTFAAPAPAQGSAVAVVILGRRSGTSCRSVLGFGAYAGRTEAGQWSRFDNDAKGTASGTVDGATLTIKATDAALAADVDCAIVGIRQGDTEIDTGGPVALQLPDADGDGLADRDDQCPQEGAQTSDGCPPKPAPAPAPEDPKPAPAPEPVPPKPTATSLERYDAAVAKCPRRTSKARSRCLDRAKKANRAGAALAKKRRTNPLIGRAYLRSDIDVGGFCGGACIEGYVFSDDRFVHRGVPEDGPAIARCTAVTATGDKDGCLRYTYSAKTKTATVAGKKLKLDEQGRLTGDGNPLFRVAVPATGSRHDAKLDNISSFGIPGVNQSFSTSQLSMAKDGRFVTAGQVSGTTGGGSDVETNYVALGKDQKGTYVFEPGGTLALFYEDGRITRRSALVAFAAKGALGTVTKDGLLLDGAPYLPDDD